MYYNMAQALHAFTIAMVKVKYSKQQAYNYADRRPENW
jgi:hypothetical protein